MCIFASDIHIIIMAYDINTYKATLDSYLTSGVKHLRYVRKSLGKACIYYPIINDAQIKSYRTDQIFKEGRTTYYNNSMPYSEWDWFKSAYVIQGLDELDTSVKADYFVLIVGTMAALVKLTSNNYETERLSESTIYDIQSYFLLKASKRITRSGSYFYRYAYNHGRFDYGNRRLPFKQVVKISTDKDYTSDSIFTDYVKQVSVDEVDNLLQQLLDRYIRGCKGANKDVSKRDWFNHTKATFDIQKYDTKQLEDVRKKILDFCTRNTNTTNLPIPTNVITTHYTAIKGTVDISKLYDVLCTEGYIDGQTTKDDFIYFFSGKGNYPSKKINWKGKKVLLAILIGNLHTPPFTDWKTTEAIFEDVKGDNLKKQFNGNKSDSKSEKIIKQLIQRAK